MDQADAGIVDAADHMHRRLETTNLLLIKCRADEITNVAERLGLNMAGEIRASGLASTLICDVCPIA